MSQLRVPFTVINNDAPTITTVYTREVDNGKYVVRVIPSWPCLVKDGAGSSMFFRLECIFIDKFGREYEVKEIKWED